MKLHYYGLRASNEFLHCITELDLLLPSRVTDRPRVTIAAGRVNEAGRGAEKLTGTI